ncbi:MAG: LIC_10190 family membrane protein [Desulfobaccales bacterium]
MLAILIIWLYAFALCFIYGCAANKLLPLLLQEKASGKLPFPLLVILGLCLVTTVVGYFSLFIKIAFGANALLFLGALLLAGVYHGEITGCLKSGVQELLSLNKYVLILFLLSFLFILIKSAAPPSAFDTGLYHAQAIRWIEEYPVVPGLGNLHGRLAFNSAWFPVNALFGFSFLKLQPFHVLNGFFVLIFVFICLQGLSNLIAGQYSFSNILRAALSLPGLFVFKDQLSSPTPDIPAAFLVCLIFIYYLQLQEKADGVPEQLGALVICLLAAWTITIKLSALPLALFIAIIAAKEIARGRQVNLLIITGGVLFLAIPYFLRNIWLSGYLIYPFPGLDLFHFDWQVPAAAALAEKQAVEAFARDPGYLLPGVKCAFTWVPLWIHQTMADYGSKLEKIFLPGLIILLDGLMHLRKRKAGKIALGEMGRYKVIYLLAAAGLLFWFLTAPDPRFGLGFIMIAAVIIFLPLLQAFDYQVTGFFPWSMALLVLYFLVAFGLQDLPALGPRVWFPSPYPQEQLVVEEIQGHQVYFPRSRDGKCWYAPLPSAYRPADFAFRGAAIADGFKARSAP